MPEMDVIGGEFRIDSGLLNGENRNEMTPAYSLGRTCLYSILQSLKEEKKDGIDAVEELHDRRRDTVLLPDYICSSVANVPERLNISIRHYHIRSDFTPDQDSIRKSIFFGNESIVLVSYFGMIQLDTAITMIRRDYPDVIIIVDDVQNFYGFGHHIDFDYCFSSYRKWFCVPDGADIIRKKDTNLLDAYSREAEYVSYKAAGNLLKNYRVYLGDSISLDLLSKGERMMEEEYLNSCSDFSRELIQKIDMEQAREKRRSNAYYLHCGLARLGIEHIYYTDAAPLFIPIVISDRDNIRKQLFENHIFSPVHWPVISSRLQGENELYDKELSLICDQRYNEEDMERILEVLEHAM